MRKVEERICVGNVLGRRGWELECVGMILDGRDGRGGVNEEGIGKDRRWRRLECRIEVGSENWTKDGNL